ncbi:hypothetical protein C2G38_2050972 [Gigaspora rosea]|uniref:F-box domain-containing protein n=1 Tax=Gigaspora rosea TaxID=44941 RepID=A0A397TV90_9GLOM|nr:hypothetical protein C2G38_2050972 [Gigaspora rosea]
MTRKNPTPKQFLQKIILEHLKYLKRIKAKIPQQNKQCHKLIEAHEKATKKYQAKAIEINEKAIDNLKNEFEEQKKKFEKIIKNLERENRKLKYEIRKKDEQIQELEVQMEGLKFENSNLANQLEEEREKNKFIKENKIFKLVQLTTQIFYNNLLFFRICSYLSPEDLVSLSKVNRSFYLILWLEKENESIWKYSLQQMPDQICPIQMTVKQYCRLRFDKTCQFCSQPNNNCTILELKIRICRQCRELELTSRLNLEESSYPSELIPALHSVDYEQLNGNYLDNSV